MEELAERFRREAQERSGRIYSEELRRLAVEYACWAQAGGQGKRKIAASLGLSTGSLVEWLRGRAEPDGSVGLVLHEVSVVEEVSARPVLVMPSGIRVEGLLARDLVAILGVLG